MRLYQQLVLFMLAATVLPLALVGFWVLRQSEDALRQRLQGEQIALATAAAESTAFQLMGAIDALSRASELIDWKAAQGDELRGALSLLYQQSPLVSAVVLVRHEGGARSSRSEPVFLREAGGGHRGFSPEQGLERLVEAIPLAPLLKGGRGAAAISSVYETGAAEAPAIAVAVKLDEGVDAPFALAELSLHDIEQALRARATEADARLELWDGDGRVVAASRVERRLTKIDPAQWGRLHGALEGRSSIPLKVEQPEGQLGAAARVPDRLGLVAVALLPEATAIAPVRTLRRTVLGATGLGVVVLLVLGGLFTRRINRRLLTVAAGAEAFARGDLSRRLPVIGKDELAELAVAFNHMGAELETARGRLTRWNEELKEQVEAATADLKAAQAQLVEAQKLAAIGQLGAGVAHEINNPLCGILGNAQLMMLERSEQDPDFETLHKIEQSAKRCKEITDNLLRFSQIQGHAELRATDLNAVVRSAVHSAERGLREDGVQLELSLPEMPPTIQADPAQLAAVLGALISNARTAMAKAATKRLVVAAREEGGEVLIEVRDSGKGIKREHLERIFDPFFTTKDVWSNVGLGLSVAYRMVQDHHGRIEVDSQEGHGATFRVRIPAIAQAPEPRPSPAVPVGGQGVGVIR